MSEARKKRNNTTILGYDTCLEIQEILCDEIVDEKFLEFVIENLSELLSYIESGRVYIRIHRDITGEVCLG